MAMRQLPHVVAVDPGLFLQNFRTGHRQCLPQARLAQDSEHHPQRQHIGHQGNAGLHFLEGRIWTQSEEERSAKVVVLGHDAAEDLFPGESPIGKEVDCEGRIFTVIGVLDVLPQPFGSGRNTQDNQAFFPVETFRKLHPEVKDFWITVKYDDPANKALVIDELRELLRRRRNVRLEQDDNFAIFGPDSLTRLWNTVTGGLFLFMVAVSSVGLMVGGVGVMNIMLVSVTERTREIGVRKAIGATKKNILLQFTLEAVTLCVVGGLFGISLGALVHTHPPLCRLLPSCRPFHDVGSCRPCCFLRHRPHLRHLSRLEGRQPGPHRGATVRIRQLPTTSL